MAEFTGTIKEFKKFIGPRVKNIVPPLTKKRKKELSGICQMCGEKAELQAAHKRGMSRLDIIEKILTKYRIDDQIIKIDLETIDREIINAHTPVDDYFLFICQECHRKYDHEPEVMETTDRIPVVIERINTILEKRLEADADILKLKTIDNKDEILDKVQAYCEHKGLSDGTARSAVSRVRGLMKIYENIPEPAKVSEDMKKKGANSKSISDTLWALKIWASVVDT